MSLPTSSAPKSVYKDPHFRLDRPVHPLTTFLFEIAVSGSEPLGACWVLVLESHVSDHHLCLELLNVLVAARAAVDDVMGADVAMLVL